MSPLFSTYPFKVAVMGFLSLIAVYAANLYALYKKKYSVWHFTTNNAVPISTLNNAEGVEDMLLIAFQLVNQLSLSSSIIKKQTVEIGCFGVSSTTVISNIAACAIG